MADVTTTSSSSYPDWAQPYALGFLQRAQQVTDTPYQQYQGPLVADMNQYQTQALGGIANRAVQGSPVMSAGSQTLQNTLNGSYLNGNPYLQSQIDSAQGDLVRQWNNVAKPQWDTSMQQSGSFGNSGVAQAQAMAQEGLQRQLGNIDTTMRSNAYNTERGYQNSAMSLAPTYANQDYTDLNNLLTAGNQYQTQNQNQATAGYQQYLDARNYPTSQLQAFGSALGSAVGNQGTQTTTQPGASTGSQIVGGALTGAGLYNLLFGG